jgi:hypothetical protein
VKSGWNWLFIHKTPNVIPWILMRLKYSAFPSLYLDFVAFSLLVKKSVKNMAKLGWKHRFFSIGSTIINLPKNIYIAKKVLQKD